jgi:hypothetical protein
MFRSVRKHDFQFAPPVSPEVDELLRYLYVRIFAAMYVLNHGRLVRAFIP